MKKLLTVAGSDSSGGAGIQADLKTFAALGAYGMSCVASLTAQNTTGVTMVVNTPPEMVKAQLEAVFADIPPDAVKTGMLSTPAITEAVADFFSARSDVPLVVDPVMVATTGAVLMEKEAIEIYRTRLIPEATVITPNIPEAEVLSDREIKNTADMEAAAKEIFALGCKAVLVKGGHAVADATDVLYDGTAIHYFRGEKIETENTHGTGCTLSSAIAVYLAEGFDVPEAVGRAKKYLTGALKSAKDNKVGHGNGPVDHFWFYGDKWGALE